GWWGLISLILTPCFILNNTVRYLLCLGMPPVPAYATPRAQEELSPEEVHRKIEPFLEEIFERLNQGAYLDDLAEEYAPRAELPRLRDWGIRRGRPAQPTGCGVRWFPRLRKPPATYLVSQLRLRAKGAQLRGQAFHPLLGLVSPLLGLVPLSGQFEVRGEGL